MKKAMLHIEREKSSGKTFFWGNGPLSSGAKSALHPCNGKCPFGRHES